MEILPPVRRRVDRFLNVMVAQSASGAAVYGARRIPVSTGELVGAEVAWRGQAVCALFDRRLDDTPVAGPLAYEVGDHPGGSRHLLFGLPAGAVYGLTVVRTDGGIAVRLEPGGGGRRVAVDPRGVLRFRIEGHEGQGGGRKGGSVGEAQG